MNYVTSLEREGIIPTTWLAEWAAESRHCCASAREFVRTYSTPMKSQGRCDPGKSRDAVR